MHQSWTCPGYVLSLSPCPCFLAKTHICPDTDSAQIIAKELASCPDTCGACPLASTSPLRQRRNSVRNQYRAESSHQNLDAAEIKNGEPRISDNPAVNQLAKNRNDTNPAMLLGTAMEKNDCLLHHCLLSLKGLYCK